MKNGKYLSDVLDTSNLKHDQFNVIVAPCGSGKTTAAINKLAPLASSPRKALFLIDTHNGNVRLANEEPLTMPYVFYEYSIKNAAFVVTDSFHGCVFSLIYSKQFFVFKRFADSNSKSQNSRVYTLLQEYNLNKCLIDANTAINKAFIEQEEFLKINEKIELNSNKAKKWLFDSIEDIG